MSPKFLGRGEEKFFKSYSQTVGDWCVVFTSMRWSERTVLGTAVTFLNKLQMYLQIKSARVYAAYSQGSGFGVACSQMEGSPRELCLHYQIKESSQRRQNSSHLFLKKSLYFIFNLGTVISQFSLLGESVLGRYDNHIFLSPKELPPFPKPYSSLESSTTSSLAALSGVL